MTKGKRWELVLGMKPHRVVAFEDLTRNGVVHLRWSLGHGKRTIRSLGFGVRGARGGLDRELVERAERAAVEQHTALLQGRSAPRTAKAPAQALTIDAGWKRASDPELGKWNKDTAHRKDIERAIKRAVATWGPALTWDEVDRGQLRKLWRTELARQRAQNRPGVRSAGLTLALVLAVGAWLRDEQLVAPTAALRWKQMDDEFNSDAGEYTPHRPRYTLEEYQKLFETSWLADERYGLLYSLGAEYRLGQVSRSRRSDVDLELKQLRSPGRSKKKGAVIKLTPYQFEDLVRVLTTGYLAELEAAFQSGEIADYQLIPGHHLHHRDDGTLVARVQHATRTFVDRTVIRSWHRVAEEIAEIPHIKGRGPYAARRAGVDAAKAQRISREGLQEHGGWSDAQIPDSVYADQERDYARDEAAEVRAKIRGEVAPAPVTSNKKRHKTSH